MAKPAPNWPDIQQMLEQLQSSGFLNPQAAPTGPIQPLPHPPNAQLPTHYQNLVGITAVDHPTLKVETTWRDNPLFHKFSKALGVALSFEGMFGIYRSLQFLFVEYPLLEKALNSHQISLEEVNHFAAKAIIEIFSTIIGLLFAAKLTILHTKTLHVVHILFGFIFFILNALLMLGYLDHYNFVELFLGVL